MFELFLKLHKTQNPPQLADGVCGWWRVIIALLF